MQSFHGRTRAEFKHDVLTNGMRRTARRRSHTPPWGRPLRDIMRHTREASGYGAARPDDCILHPRRDAESSRLAERSVGAMSRIQQAMIMGLVVVVTAVSASAASVEYVGLGRFSSVDIYHNGNTATVKAGELNVKVDTIPLVAFCVDLDHSVKPAWSANEVPVTAILGGKAAAYLYDTFRPLVSDNTTAAALQVAIWEVIDDPTGPYDLGAGNFRLFGAASIATQANTYLAAIPGDLSGYVTPSYILDSVSYPYSQDLIVPEPGTLMALMLGLPLFLARRGNAFLGVFRA
jgi:hypothetical protein